MWSSYSRPTSPIIGERTVGFVGSAPKKDAVVVLVGVGVTEGVSRNVVPDTAVGSIPAAVGLGRPTSRAAPRDRLWPVWSEPSPSAPPSVVWPWSPWPGRSSTCAHGFGRPSAHSPEAPSTGPPRTPSAPCGLPCRFAPPRAPRPASRRSARHEPRPGTAGPPHGGRPQAVPPSGPSALVAAPCVPSGPP